MNKSSKNIGKNKLINISELARELDLLDKKSSKLSTHTLRFWESKFKQIKPTIVSGRRYYSKKDVDPATIVFSLVIILALISKQFSTVPI